MTTSTTAQSRSDTLVSGVISPGAATTAGK
jgi:hypothetical protein